MRIYQAMKTGVDYMISKLNSGVSWICGWFENSLGETLRKYFASYFWVVFGLLLLTPVSISAPFYAPEQVTGILFSHAALLAAISFHIFSVGNTIYSVAVSINNVDLFRKGTVVTGNATMIAISSGILFITGYGWRIPWYSFPFSEYFSGLSLKWNAAFLILLSQLFLLIGILLHGAQHTWYNEVEDSIVDRYFL